MSKKALGRLLLLAGTFILIALFAWEVLSEELNIIEVRHNIPLSDDEPVYRDYYINTGAEGLLKKNLVVTVTRKMILKDATGSQTHGDIKIPIGQLKIIALGNKISVAREHKLFSRGDEPMLEQTGLMIGDTVEIKGSFVDNRKLPAKKVVEVIKPDLQTPAEMPPEAVKAVIATEAKVENKVDNTIGKAIETTAESQPK